MLELIHPAERFRNIRVVDTSFHRRLSFCQKLVCWKLLMSPDNPDLGKAEHFGQRASAFLRPVIGSRSANRNQQYWNLIGEKAEFTRDAHRIEADHRARAEPIHFGGI